MVVVKYFTKSSERFGFAKEFNELCSAFRAYRISKSSSDPGPNLLWKDAVAVATLCHGQSVLVGIMHVNDQEESFAKVRALESGRSNPTNIFNIHNSLAPQRVLSTCCGHLRTRSLPRGPINSASPLVSRVQTPFETCLMSSSIYWLLRAQARAWSQAGNRAWTATQHSCFISPHTACGISEKIAQKEPRDTRRYS